MFSRTFIQAFAATLLLLVFVSCGGDGDELQADAGDDFSVVVGESPTFDGCASNGDIGNYQWVIIEAPSGMQGDAGKPIREVDPDCSFTLDAAMIADEAGTWVIELTVSDNDGNKSTDTVNVEVTP